MTATIGVRGVNLSHMGPISNVGICYIEHYERQPQYT